MKYLWDTHALIWFGENDPQLSKKAKQAIESLDNEKYVSLATLWEMSIKSSLGKLQLKMQLKAVIAALQENGFLLLPISPDHVLQVETLPFLHKDPFDRLLIAQAIHEDFFIVSNEVPFDDYGVKRLW